MCVPNKRTNMSKQINGCHAQIFILKFIESLAKTFIRFNATFMLFKRPLFKDFSYVFEKFITSGLEEFYNYFLSMYM